MRNNILKSILFLAPLTALLSFDLPSDWFIAGSKPKSYEMGIDKGAGQDGKNAATIKSIDPKIEGFGTLMQECKPGKFLNKRVRMTGYIRSENLSNRAALWLRVDQAGTEKALSFDNMAGRQVKGTTAWTKYEIVLDVPESASMLAYGALLNGTGQIWFDNITFEIVDNTVKTTGSSNNTPHPLKNEPVNLDFEK